jgi:hypothetical protein
MGVWTTSEKAELLQVAGASNAHHQEMILAMLHQRRAAQQLSTT